MAPKVKAINSNTKSPMEILEHALVMCKFGRFQIRLMLTSLAAICATTMVSTTSSFILPIAECDLNMGNLQKGLLNAMPFFGQVAASPFMGFLTDAFGRRIFLVVGNLGIFICSLIQGCSQNYWMLIFGKTLDGIFLSLCFSPISAMVSECVDKTTRDRALLVSSAFMPISLITIALMSWAILPQKWHFVLLEGYFELKSWNMYLFICSIWSLLAGLSYIFLPESPKFLLSHDQEKEALHVLRKIYKENTGLPEDSFPIKTLNDTKKHSAIKHSIKKQITNALLDLKELFRRPHSLRLALLCSIIFVCLLAYTSLRLWFPQISTIVEAYERKHNESAQFCIIINDYTVTSKPNVSPALESASELCVPNISGAETYINCIIMGFVSLCFMGIGTCLVQFVGQKPLIFIGFILCSICSGVLYWARTSLQITLLISATCGMVQLSMSLLSNVGVRVFPTTVRTITISMMLTVGRIGSLLGSVLFPILLEAGCMGPFLVLCVISLCVAGLVYFVPNPQKHVAGDN